MTKDLKITLSELDTPVKILFTGYLTTVAIGYLFALIQILFTHGMADGKFGLSIDDIVYSYYGNRSGTVLETKLNGSMKDKATEQERFALMQWVRDGALEKEYTSLKPQKIIEAKCQMCHNEGASGIPDFTEFENIKELAKQDEGATFASLTRVSHIHLFGISFIFMFVGLIFSFSTTASSFYKSIAIGMPYAFLIVDILSWWLTKLSPMFASLIMVAGTGMGASFAFMWVVSLKEMWFIDNPWFCNPDSPCQRTIKVISGFTLNSLAFIGGALRNKMFPKVVATIKSAFDRIFNKK
ncbi:hypothetical protein [Methyloprofundus sp.]|uniref:hypothetical protein n=1 Tax=Methyloprofundus sp. TaxID=2020875 RepID=UPI003D0E51C4